MRTRIIAAVALLLITPLAANAVPIGTVQTFNGNVTIDDAPGGGCTDCIINGWLGQQLAVDAGKNGAGDNALLYDLGGETGFHVQTWIGYPNVDTAFLGDLLGAGITHVQFDARHAGGADLFLRAFVFDEFSAFDGAYSATGAAITSADTEWATYTISLDPLKMLLSEFNETPGITVEDILSATVQFGLRHDPGGDGPGNPDFVTAAAYFDNIRLVSLPEPGTVLLFGLGLIGIGLMRRRRV